MTATKKDILQGWKDIAAYVSRDVRTVKRWEKQRGLPVRRMPGDGRANVYALIPELDSWLSVGIPVESATDTLPATDMEEPEPDELTSPETPASTETLPAVPQPAPRTRPLRYGWKIAAAAILAAGALAAVALGVRAHLHERDTADIPPFSPTQTARSIKYSSHVPGVDALYLRGVYFFEQRTPETLDHAIRYFTQATQRDPSYAPAYAGLSETYNLLRQYSTMPDETAYAKAEDAARHAIQLDPNLSEAHASLGFILFFWHWQPVEAEREFQRAIQLDASSALAHHWYGSMLTHQGRFAESIQHLDEAQRLQPASISILSDRAFSLGMSGHRNEAADMLQEVLNEDPKSPAPHLILAHISMEEPRDIPRYLDESRRFAAMRHDPQGQQTIDLLDAAYRSGGATGMWRARLALEQKLHPAADDPTFERAIAEAVLGMREQALHDLEILAARHDLALDGITIDPMLTPLRREPRFQAIIARLGGVAPV